MAKQTVRVHKPTGEQGRGLDPDGAVGLRRVTAVGGGGFALAASERGRLALSTWPGKGVASSKTEGRQDT